MRTIRRYGEVFSAHAEVVPVLGVVGWGVVCILRARGGSSIPGFYGA